MNDLEEAGDPIEEIAKMFEDFLEKHYNPLAKIKLTEAQIRRLIGDCEPISIGFKKKLTMKSIDKTALETED